MMNIDIFCLEIHVKACVKIPSHAERDLQVTHSSSPVTPLTLDGTVLKKPADLVILWMTFDA